MLILKGLLDIGINNMQEYNLGKKRKILINFDDRFPM